MQAPVLLYFLCSIPELIWTQ